MHISLPLLLAFLSGVSFAFLGLSYKLAEARGCRSTPFAFAFTATAGLVAGIRSHWETTTWGDPRLWALGIGMGIVLYGGILLMVAANRRGPASITWTILQLAILLPIVLAPWLFHETFHLLDIALIVLFVLTMLAFARDMATGGDMKAEHLLPYLGVLAVVFLDNGIFTLGHKTKYALFGEHNSAALATLFYCTSTVLALGVHLWRERPRTFRPVELSVGLLAGGASSLGILLFLGSMRLPVVVSYPASQGTALLGGVFLTLLFYRERMTPWKITGILLGLAMLVLTALRQSA